MTRQCAACIVLLWLALDVAQGQSRHRAPDPTAPDLVVSGASVITPGMPDPGATAVSIRGDRVVALTASPGGEHLDSPGSVILPGLVDHHIHLLNVGLWLLNDRDQGVRFLDLTSVQSLEEVARLVRARAERLPAGTWITGSGWSQAAWGTGRLPAAGILDAASPDHPVYLARVDGHAGWVNHATMRAAGITDRTPDPGGGRIVRDAAGHATGILLERANELVAPLLPQPDDDDVATAFRLAAGALAARGVVEVDDAGVLAAPGVVALNADFERYLRLLRDTDAREPLPIRVNLMIPAPSVLAESLLSSKRDWRISPRIRITALKLFADGALGSRGAALTHPYADDPSTAGVPRMSSAAIEALASRALDAGLAVATHAIGDLAVERTLDAYERILRHRPGLDPRRLRIEHFSYAREDDFARAVRLRVVLSIQSDFNASPAEAAPLALTRTGEANALRVYAWRRLYDMGADLLEGSDAFIMLRQPFAGYHDALTLKNAIGDGPVDSPLRAAALAMQMAHLGPDGTQMPGSVEPGARADLIVVDGNPLRVPVPDLLRLRVLATVNAGRVAFRAPDK